MADPMHDPILLELVDREKTFNRLLQLTPDTPGFAELRFAYFASAQRLSQDVARRIRER